jgi:diacylglycerol kinase (ATP)
MRVQLDDHRPVRRDAMLCVVGNIGKLQGNLTLIPGARPDDGVLDLYIASPRGFWHWVKLALRLIANRPRRDDQVGQHSGWWRSASTARTTTSSTGDIGGESTTLTAEIEPGALTVCAPTPVPGTPHQ